MRVYLVFLVLMLLAGCATKPPVTNDSEFKIEFGKIVEEGQFYQIRPNDFKVELEDGYEVVQIAENNNSKFGFRIENLSRKKYDLAYYIGIYDEESKDYVDFSQGGYWTITPPNNPEYEAFIWENDKTFSPGYYKFVVLINNHKAIKVINFKIIKS